MRKLEYLAQKLAENSGAIISLFILNFFTIAWQNIHTYKTSQLTVLTLDFIFVLAGTLVLIFIITFLPATIKKFILRITIGLSLILGSLECFAIYNYQALVGAGIITAILQTNSNEAGEFFKMYVGFKGLAAVAVFLAVLLAVNFARRYLPPLKIKHKRLLGGFLSSIIVAGAICGIIIWRDFHSFVVNDMLDIPLVRITRSSFMAANNIRAFEELASKTNNTVEITANDSDVPYIVFILGESTNRERMHLYGYPLENTPNLDTLAKNNEIAVFRDTISSQGATVASLREMLTFHDAESGDEWYSYNNLIDVMKQAGYKTYWLSNQESSGIWGNVAQLFAGRSDVKRFTQLRESHEDSGRLDEELFPLFDAALQEGAAKNFYILHLMGGHGLYYMRFPYIFTKFTAKDIPPPQNNYSAEKRTEIAQYENALFYNDWIVSSLIGKLETLDAIVIYLPDHGETVYDNDSNFAGHVEENPNRQQLEVPFIIWGSPSYREKHSKTWQKILASTDRPYMTDDIIHTIMDIARIETPEFSESKSVINDNFDAARVRIVRGKNYDTEMKNK